ncbi:bifunctional glycosyltransferase family 2/GtrA family protein [Methylomonas sp. MK1]|uniref:bifunctional glycosyltransferase family 2/GtrA family protein n=1 Tax=Methylomonas sp. MK1 TaxID=1131552 RepID=UPI00035E4EB3|nr:bifunctional glycosyltransferase family 2/GtrA family protein [Methylomonas sp. MK1]
MFNQLKIAVLIPCHNEEVSIAKVVSDFRQVLPDATIYVFDNNSSDNTVSAARSAGAMVRHETQQGKGHVVRRMFRDIDADFYLMVDGDDTYDANLAPDMIKLAMSGPYDLVNCIRRETGDAAYRGGHRFGNRLLTGVVRQIFGNRILDMLSGYKVFSRRFVKSFPALSTGFDIETELTVHTLELSMPAAHIEGEYRGRPAGSESKLRTYRDGWRILMLIIRLVRHERPMVFFGGLAGLLVALALLLIWPVILTYLDTGLVPRFPTAFLAMGIMLLASLSVFTGTILDTVTRGRKELRMLTYLQYPPPVFVPNAFADSAAILSADNTALSAGNDDLLGQMWRFGLVGVVGYIVNAGLVESLVLNMGPLRAQMLAFPAAVTVTWWLNRRFTFGASHHAMHHEWLRYVLANMLGWTANNGAYLWMIFSVPLAYQHPALAVAVGSLAGMVLNFSASRLIVFKKIRQA